MLQEIADKMKRRFFSRIPGPRMRRQANRVQCWTCMDEKRVNRQRSMWERLDLKGVYALYLCANCSDIDRGLWTLIGHESVDRYCRKDQLATPAAIDRRWTMIRNRVRARY